MAWIPDVSGLPLGKIFRRDSTVAKIAMQRELPDLKALQGKLGYTYDKYKKGDVITIQQITLSKVAQPIKLNDYNTSRVVPIASILGQKVTGVK